MEQITQLVVQQYITGLVNSGHNKGGVYSHYAPIRTFLKWYADQTDTPNPIEKYKLKRPGYTPLPVAEIKDIRGLLLTCKNDFFGLRDRFIILALIDTGARASELLALVKEDIDLISGLVKIRHGKGDRFRFVKIGRETLKAYRRYLKVSRSNFVFTNYYQDQQLTISGLRLMLIRRSKKAGVKYHSPHSYRRLCNVILIRAGVNIYSIMAYMGHSSIEVEKRHYAAMSGQDIDTAFIQANPVENLGLR